MSGREDKTKRGWGKLEGAPGEFLKFSTQAWGGATAFHSPLDVGKETNFQGGRTAMRKIPERDLKGEARASVSVARPEPGVK